MYSQGDFYEQYGLYGALSKYAAFIQTAGCAPVSRQLLPKGAVSTNMMISAAYAAVSEPCHIEIKTRPGALAQYADW